MYDNCSNYPLRVFIVFSYCLKDLFPHPIPLYRICFKNLAVTFTRCCLSILFNIERCKVTETRSAASWENLISLQFFDFKPCRNSSVTPCLLCRSQLNGSILRIHENLMNQGTRLFFLEKMTYCPINITLVCSKKWYKFYTFFPQNSNIQNIAMVKYSIKGKTKVATANYFVVKPIIPLPHVKPVHD